MILRNLWMALSSTRGRRIAGTLPPQLVIASKRNGAYAGDIQLSRWIGQRCLKVEQYRRPKSGLKESFASDGRTRELWLI